jgi:hypothetical protein
VQRNIAAPPMPIRQLVTYYAAPTLLVIFLIASSVRAYSTATTVIVTENGIVIATDSEVGLEQGMGEGTIGHKVGTKVFVVNGHFAIASLGKQFFNFVHKTDDVSDFSFPYDFGAWIHQIEGGLPHEVSFDDFAHTVNIEVHKLIPELQTVVSNGGLRPRNPVDIFEPFITYVIAGFQNGSPRLYVLKFYIDWETKIVLEPYLMPIELQPIAGHTRSYFLGITEAATNFHNPQSYAYKQAMATCPKAFQNIISHRPISLDESIALAKVFIKIEEQVNPNEVGGNIRVVRILPDGRANDLIDDLSKTPPEKHKKQH